MENNIIIQVKVVLVEYGNKLVGSFGEVHPFVKKSL